MLMNSHPHLLSENFRAYGAFGSTREFEHREFWKSGLSLHSITALLLSRFQRKRRFQSSKTCHFPQDVPLYESFPCRSSQTECSGCNRNIIPTEQNPITSRSGFQKWHETELCTWIDLLPIRYTLVPSSFPRSILRRVQYAIEAIRTKKYSSMFAFTLQPIRGRSRNRVCICGELCDACDACSLNRFQLVQFLAISMSIRLPMLGKMHEIFCFTQQFNGDDGGGGSNIRLHKRKEMSNRESNTR